VARVRSLGGYAIAQHDSPNKGGPMSGHRGSVLHIAQGSYRGTIAWQLNPDQRYADGTRVNTCSTFIVGKERGEWAQMVDTDLIAWCQRDGSRTWLSVELAGFAPAAPTEWQVWACAQLLAWDHRTYGTSLQVAADPSVRGLGHHSMDREWLGEEWGHEACPGTGVIAAKPAIVRLAQSIMDGGDDMEQTERLVHDTGLPSRTVGNVLADMQNLRNWLVSPPAGASIGAPPSGSVGAILLEAARRPPVAPAPVDQAAVDAAVAAALARPDVLAAIARAVVDEQRARLES
jgi:hypothetical protein